MSFVPGYEHDIFVSYATVDDQPPAGAERGWISTLFGELKRLLAEEVGRRGGADVWMDYRLGANDALSHTIFETLDGSATLLIILSPGYLESDWCTRELAAFTSRLQQMSGAGCGRIFLIEKRPIDAEAKPEPIRDIRGRRLWRQDEFDRAYTLGDPTPRVAETAYYREVAYLARDIADQLKSMASDHEAGRTTTESTTDTDYQVLLADVTDDLYDKREEVKRYLQQQGVSVVDRYYSKADPVEFRRHLEADIQQCRVFVQLLSDILGRRPPGAESGFNALQYEVAKGIEVDILQWYSPELDIDRLDEGPQKQLLQRETVYAEPFESFKSRVVESAQRLPPSTKEPRTESIVFLNYRSDDQGMADEILNWVDSRGIGYMTPMSSGRPEEIREDLKTNIQESDCMMLLYGQSPESWVKTQLLTFRKLRGWQRKGLAVFDGPPPDKPAVGMKLPGMQVLSCRTNIDWTQVEGFLSECNVVAGHA